MAHQIDFHVTLWSDNPHALLELERYLNNAQKTKLFQPIKADIIALYISLYASDMINGEVHSVDINWDDDSPNQPEPVAESQP